MATRSKRLWALVTVLRGTQIVYTTPDDRVTILKSVYVALDTVDELMTIQIRHSGTPLDVLRFTYSSGQSNLASWSGWIVLEPSDQVAVFCNMGTVRSWGSGAELPPRITA